MKCSAALLIALLAARTDARGVLGAEDVAKKKEGAYMTGLPLVNFSSDAGVGYGARVYLYNNGVRTDPAFVQTPYASEWFLNFFQTTSGLQFHIVSADFPSLGDGGWRLRTRGVYEKDLNRNYFGIGGASLTALPHGGFDGYQAALDAATPTGVGSTSRWFNKYSLERPAGLIQMERQVGGAFTAMASVKVQETRITTYDGRSVPVGSAHLTQGPTLLSLDRPAGFSGGWSNYLCAGVAYDTRDFEPAPKNGWFADATAEWSAPWLGTDYRHTRETVTVRRFQTVAPGLVLAGRAVWSAAQGRLPFYEMSTLGFLDSPSESLGGGWTLRGYKENRFTGRGVALANFEIRYDAWEAVFGSQRFTFTPVAFADGGRVFQQASGFTFADWKGAAGGGIRIAWNLATIINATYGRSGEDTNVFINFGHMF